jgi:UDP-GlcNAc:undecaprenyl-phosphate GlcNAc-1-phosphate transferase
VREYGLTLLVAAAVTYLLTPLVRRMAIRLGAVPAARDRDVHAVPIPRMGGVAMYAGLAAGLLIASQLAPLNTVFPGSGLVTGLLPAGGLIVIVGMIDDRWGMNALGKLAAQVAAGGFLVARGIELSSFPLPHGHLFSLTPNESIVLTVLVVVATINAINFIDGLDGLAAGIVFIAAISFFVYYYTLAKSVGLSAEGGPALASVVLAAVCIGFLPHNFHPARIFMGDTGSMLLGLLLAYVPISAISSLDYERLNFKVNRYPEILPLLLPAAVLVIPYVDMLRAVIRRTRAGMSPFAPDRKHLHHRMLEIGHSHRSSVLILYAWAGLFSLAVVLLSFVKTPLYVLAGTTLAAVLVLVLLSLPKLRWWERGPAAGPVAMVADPVGAPPPATMPRPADPAPATMPRPAEPVPARPPEDIAPQPVARASGTIVP